MRASNKHLNQPYLSNFWNNSPQFPPSFNIDFRANSPPIMKIWHPILNVKVWEWQSCDTKEELLQTGKKNEKSDDTSPWDNNEIVKSLHSISIITGMFVLWFTFFHGLKKKFS